MTDNWYNDRYLNDPATDNVFGLEELAERRNPELLAHLRAGGQLSEFARAQQRQPSNIDKALEPLLLDLSERAIGMARALL